MTAGEELPGTGAPRRRLTAADVHDVLFRRAGFGPKGYDEREVDQFLAEVELEVGRLVGEKAELHAEVLRLRAALRPGAPVGGGAVGAPVPAGRDEAARSASAAVPPDGAASLLAEARVDDLLDRDPPRGAEPEPAPEPDAVAVDLAPEPEPAPVTVEPEREPVVGTAEPSEPEPVTEPEPEAEPGSRPTYRTAVDPCPGPEEQEDPEPVPAAAATRRRVLALHPRRDRPGPARRT